MPRHIIDLGNGFKVPHNNNFQAIFHKPDLDLYPSPSLFFGSLLRPQHLGSELNEILPSHFQNHINFLLNFLHRFKLKSQNRSCNSKPSHMTLSILDLYSTSIRSLNHFPRFSVKCCIITTLKTRHQHYKGHFLNNTIHLTVQKD